MAEWVVQVVLVVPVELEAWVAPVSPVELEAWGALAVPAELEVWVVPTVRHNYLLEELEATTGSTIPRIVAAHPMETGQRPIVSGAQLVATLSPTVRPAQETRSVAREEVSPAIEAEPAPATA